MTAVPDDWDDPPVESDRAAWARAGVPYDEIDGWRRWRIAPTEARLWRRAGVQAGLSAAQWQTAAVTPATVEAWVEAGIDSAEAVRWHEFGFDLEGAKSEKAKGNGPEQALHAGLAVRNVGWTRVGRSGPAGMSGPPIVRLLQTGGHNEVVHGYLRHEWTDESAVAWAQQGITVTDAYLWFDLGLTAVEAGRLIAGGRAAGEVIREWWRTRIPFEEIAEWIGAGLSPEEAVAQRAAGVTVDQAAALRALRQGEQSPSQPATSSHLSRRMGPPGSEQAGPPPADPEAARQQIIAAFSGMLQTLDDNGGLSLVEGGSNLGPSLAAAHARVGEGAPTTVTVTAVKFINDHQARVAYDLYVGGTTNLHMNGRIGAALRVNGEWRVKRQVVVELLTMGGTICPPPPTN